VLEDKAESLRIESSTALAPVSGLMG